MATKRTVPSHLRQHGSRKLVGWERWADGKRHTLKRGEDFPANTSVESKRLAFAQWCRRRWLSYGTEIHGQDTLVVWVDVPRGTQVPDSRFGVTL